MSDVEPFAWDWAGIGVRDAFPLFSTFLGILCALTLSGRLPQSLHGVAIQVYTVVLYENSLTNADFCGFREEAMKLRWKYLKIPTVISIVLVPLGSPYEASVQGICGIPQSRSATETLADPPHRSDPQTQDGYTCTPQIRK